MPVIVGAIVTERANRKRVLVYVLRAAYEGLYKIAAPYVVREIAEKLASEWIVAHVLYYRAAIGVGMRLSQLICRRGWESLQQKRFNILIPRGVDYCLVSEDRIARRYVCDSDIPVAAPG